MSSGLHTTTNQSPETPTNIDLEHTPIIKVISNHEIEVDISHFHEPQTKEHYVKTITLYSLKRIVETIHFDKAENVYMAVFDLDVINKKDRELCEINEWTPRNWKSTDPFHAVIECNKHGNWCDVENSLL